MEGKYSAYPLVETQEEEQQVNVLELVRLLLSKWYLLILTGILTAAVSFCIGYFVVVPQFVSSITLNVDNARVESGTGDASSSDVSAARSLAETYRILLRSNSVMEEMVKRLAEKGVYVSEKELSKCIKVSVVSKTQILEVAVETADRERSYQIATMYEQVAPEMIVKLSNRGNIYIVDHARRAEQNTYNNLTRITTGAFFLGVVLCAAVLILRKFIDRRVYTAEEIEQELHLSVIGEIPMGGLETENGAQYYAVQIEGETQ